MKDWKKLLPDVTKLLGVHYTKGRSGRKVQFVVVHYNAGNLTIQDCYNVWQTRVASAHYQVEDDGTIGQLVYDSNTAWHAGDWDANCKSIGIEHANRSDGTIAEKCLDNGAHLVAAICHYYSLGRPQWLKNVYPHKHFQSTSCPGQIYGSQKDAYIERCQYWYDKMDGKDVDEPSSGGSSSSGAKKTISQLADEVMAGKWGNDPQRSRDLAAAGYDAEAVQDEVNRRYGISSKPMSSKPSSSSGKTIVVGSKVKVTSPYDENGTHLAVSGTYDVVEVKGDRVVIARNGTVIAACPRKNLQLVSGGGSSSSSSKPASSSKTWKVGAKVKVTKPYDENGTHLAVSGTYTIMEIRGNRVVIGRGGVVTAALSKSNLKLA